MRKFIITFYILLLSNPVFSSGNGWLDVGGGTNSAVKTLCEYQNILYAGGSFVTAGNTSSEKIARWDGSLWSSVGGGLDGDVNTMAVFNNELVAAGNFTLAGGTVSVSNIAKWNGSSWSSLGSGTNSYVNALVVSAGLHHLAPPMVIFVLFLLCRALFGGFGSAANPATQAYLAERTTREERTQAMATLAGAFAWARSADPCWPRCSCCRSWAWPDRCSPSPPWPGS